jgi:hypothetical protein
VCRGAQEYDTLRYVGEHCGQVAEVLQDDVVLEAPPLRAGSWEYFHVPVPVAARDSPLLVEMAFADDPTAKPRLFASRLSSGVPTENIDCLSFWGSGPYAPSLSPPRTSMNAPNTTLTPPTPPPRMQVRRGALRQHRLHCRLHGAPVVSHGFLTGGAVCSLLLESQRETRQWVKLSLSETSSKFGIS